MDSPRLTASGSMVFYLEVEQEVRGTSDKNARETFPVTHEGMPAKSP